MNGVATVIVLGLLLANYESNAAPKGSLAQGVADHRATVRPPYQQTSVSDPSLPPIREWVEGLPNLPEDYATGDEVKPFGQTFGPGQRSRLQDSSILLYHDALERLLRPRLTLWIEQQIQKNIDDPAFVYEALKVYLLLGDKAPQMDKALVLSWITRNREEHAISDGSNSEERKLMRAHLRAMLDRDHGGDKRSLNGPLVQRARETLARMPTPDKAYALLKSEASNDDIPDWMAANHGGPDMALVYEGSCGADLGEVRVRGFYTYEGFYISLLSRLQTIAERLQKEDWVFGPTTDQMAVNQQYSDLPARVLDLYSRDFIAQWTAALNSLQFKPLLAERPQFTALAVASGPTSPIQALYESIRDETTLTRERPKAAGLQTAKPLQSGADGREAIGHVIKTPQSADDTPAERPGATVENYFRSEAALVDGAPGSRPIDSLMADLNDFHRRLILAARGADKTLLAQVEEQAMRLRANAAHLPQPLSKQIDGVVREAMCGCSPNPNLARTADDLARYVTGPCEQIVSGRYPFANSDRDVSMTDFARLFSPNGVIDKFFAANLSQLANTGSRVWTWRNDPACKRKMSDATLRNFQRAAEIRDSFFPAGNKVPAVEFEVRPLALGGDAQNVTLSIDGTNIIARRETHSAATTVRWPGAGAGTSSITLAGSQPNGKTALDQTGAWALFRLVEAGASVQSGNALKVSFDVFGSTASFQFTSSSVSNPLSLSSIRQFSCPSGL